MTTLQDLTDLARECAADAIEAGGPEPVDHKGLNLLPTEPLQGDYDALASLLGRDPVRFEVAAFENAYLAYTTETHRNPITETEMTTTQRHAFLDGWESQRDGSRRNSNPFTDKGAWDEDSSGTKWQCFDNGFMMGFYSESDAPRFDAIIKHKSLDALV